MLWSALESSGVLPSLGDIVETGDERARSTTESPGRLPVTLAVGGTPEGLSATAPHARVPLRRAPTHSEPASTGDARPRSSGVGRPESFTKTIDLPSGEI